MTKQIKDEVVEARRGFLKGAGVASVGAAIAVVSGGEAGAVEAPVEQAASGYQETDHVKSYYEAAKF